jgi:hAT family C-terminal dimerisation region
MITIDEENNNKRKAIKGFDIFDSPQKTTSSFSASAAENPDAVAAKELLCQMSATREVENYLDFFAIKVASDVIPMDWWKGYRHQFPRIAKLARKWLCVTATSTPSERVFSDCGLALTAKRSRLKGNVLRDQVMIRRNA